MIYDIIISPLETVFDWIFNAVRNGFPQVGIVGAIFGVSVAINLLALPLYNIADAIQDKERKTAKSLERWTRHIRRTFKGDERFMMLSEYYRQNHYHPIYALRSTFSILIQVPFFIAAYHYLRNNGSLNGASFLFIKDLGAADNLVSLNIGSLAVTLNVLPIFMTAINCISGALYSKGLALREKSQIYILAAVFLVLLYNSPSGLVVYWIFNNVFSLAKNFIQKSKRKFRVLYVCAAVCLLVFVHCKALRSTSGEKTVLAAIFAWGLLLLPVALHLLERTPYKCALAKIKKNVKHAISIFQTRFTAARKKLAAKFAGAPRSKPSLSLLVFSGLALALLCGVLLPSSVIATSPIEFSFLGDTASPLSYIRHASFVGLGFFVFYPLAFYFLFGKKVKAALPVLMFALFVCAVCDAYVLKFNAGNIDAMFNVSDANALYPSTAIFALLPLELFAFGAFAAWLCQKRKKPYAALFAFACCVGMAGLGALNMRSINSSYVEYAQNRERYGIGKSAAGGIEPVYHLSKTGKNVIVLFLDRGIGPYVGEIFANYPQIKKQFDGFVYYPNTVSFSVSTVTGAPPLYGGYEYTQERMNERETEELRVKNTESQLVLPKLFVDAGWSATMTDPPWPNYRWSGDLSPYERLPGLTVKEVEGDYYDEFLEEKSLADSLATDSLDAVCSKQIVNFSFLQILYPLLRRTFYDEVRFHISEILIPSEAFGWMRAFSNLYFLPRLTDFDCASEAGAYISIHSLAAHDVYTPDDDFESPAAHPLTDGSEIHHRVNIAAFKQFGKFFDYLRENGCYDNTRIIIVSDHGLVDSVEKQYEHFAKGFFASGYSAMLLVKDFDSNFEVQTDDTFMTNADTLFFAKDGLGLSDTNPYTGKPLATEKAGGVNVYWCMNWDAATFTDSYKFELDDARAWHVRDNIYKEENWTPLIEWKSSHGGAQ